MSSSPASPHSHPKAPSFSSVSARMRIREGKGRASRTPFARPRRQPRQHLLRIRLGEVAVCGQLKAFPARGCVIVRGFDADGKGGTRCGGEWGRSWSCAQPHCAGQRSSLLLRRLDAFLSVVSIEASLSALRTLASLVTSLLLRVQRSISGVKQYTLTRTSSSNSTYIISIDTPDAPKIIVPFNHVGSGVS